MKTDRPQTILPPAAPELEIMDPLVRSTGLTALAAWASSRSTRPRAGDIVSRTDMQAFAREARARARTVAL